jgi:hypothetical protein
MAEPLRIDITEDPDQLVMIIRLGEKGYPLVPLRQGEHTPEELKIAIFARDSFARWLYSHRVRYLELSIIESHADPDLLGPMLMRLFSMQANVQFWIDISTEYRDVGFPEWGNIFWPSFFKDQVAEFSQHWKDSKEGDEHRVEVAQKNYANALADFERKFSTTHQRMNTIAAGIKQPGKLFTDLRLLDLVVTLAEGGELGDLQVAASRLRHATEQLQDRVRIRDRKWGKQ